MWPASLEGVDLAVWTDAGKAMHGCMASERCLMKVNTVRAICLQAIHVSNFLAMSKRHEKRTHASVARVYRDTKYGGRS